MNLERHKENVLFWSDPHFNHKNICRGTSSWGEQGTRDFGTVEQMNQELISQFNSVANENSIVFLLGDLTFGFNKPDAVKSILSRLVPCKIHWVLGNHDIDWVFREKNRHVLGMFESISMAKEISIMGQMFSLSHYAQRVWNKSHKGAIQLHGHSHSTLEGLNGKHFINKFYNEHKTMDVGVDNIFRIKGQYRPISMLEVLDIMKDRKNLLVDHHTEKTN